MFDLKVQRVLIAFIRVNAPMALAIERAALRARYAALIDNAVGAVERRTVGGEYAQAKAALVIRLSRAIQLSNT